MDYLNQSHEKENDNESDLDSVDSNEGEGESEEEKKSGTRFNMQPRHLLTYSGIEHEFAVPKPRPNKGARNMDNDQDDPLVWKYTCLSHFTLGGEHSKHCPTV